MKASIIQTTENGEPRIHICEIGGYDVYNPNAEAELTILKEIFGRHSQQIKAEINEAFAKLEENEKLPVDKLSINSKCDWLDEPIHTGIYDGNGKEYILSGYYVEENGNRHFTQQEAIYISEHVPGWEICTDEFHKALAEAVFDDDKWEWKENVCGTKLNGFEYMTQVLKYELGGFRDAGNNGKNGDLWSVGNYGFSWSSSVSGSNGLYLNFYATYLSPSYATNRASGLQVRCLQE